MKSGANVKMNRIEVRCRPLSQSTSVAVVFLDFFGCDL